MFTIIIWSLPKHKAGMKKKKYSDFHKVIVSVPKTDNEPLPLFFIQYHFNDKEHEIDCTPPCHGNNLNKDNPRQIMFPSVRN